jgi:hypothetical protein
MTSPSYLPIARLDDLAEDAPAHAEADGIDLVLSGGAGRCTSSRAAARTAAPCWPTAASRRRT